MADLMRVGTEELFEGMDHIGSITLEIYQDPIDKDSWQVGSDIKFHSVNWTTCRDALSKAINELVIQMHEQRKCPFRP